MTERFYPPVFKFTTDTLKSLPFSVLKFYATGTTTPKAVYADKYKTTSLGVTVPADSAGNFPPIFLDGIYRVELVNAAGVTQTGWPVDGVGDSVYVQFDEWDPSVSYEEGQTVTEITINGIYRYESKTDSNLNNRPTLSPNQWLRIYFGGVAYLASGSEVAYSGTISSSCSIINGQKLRIKLADESSVGILNILSSVNGAYCDAVYLISCVGTITEIADPTAKYVASSSPAAGQIGIYNTGALGRAIYIKNNTGFNIISTINLQGVQVELIEDNSP